MPIRGEQEAWLMSNALRRILASFFTMNFQLIDLAEKIPVEIKTRKRAPDSKRRNFIKKLGIPISN